MTNTALSVFDRTVQKTTTWVDDLAAKLGWDDRHNTFQALRITLHALRDRILPEEAINFGAQLPILLAGFFYENYRLADAPTKERTKEAFLGKVREEFQRTNIEADPEPVVRAVFQTIAEHVDFNQTSEVVHNMSSDLKDLWPESVQA